MPKNLTLPFSIRNYGPIWKKNLKKERQILVEKLMDKRLAQA
jgi:hypothetical protein